MKQVINLILDKKHAGRYKPHITLVYPFQIQDQQKLEQHIKKSIKNIKPFKLTLNGLKKSKKEYFLYLLVNQGKSQIMKIYRNLNSGILKGFKNPKIPRYLPHMTLGKFKSKKEIEKEIKDQKNKDLKISTKIASIQLLTLKKDDSIKEIRNFGLK